jgi:hypothetical protein
MPVDNKPLPDAILSEFTPEVTAWMAGLLEGEGYFFFNSSKRMGVRLVMTDQDVVKRFGARWAVPVRTLAKREDHQKTPFSATLPGPKAAQCMRLVLPYMGLRRAQTIRECLTAYEGRFGTKGRARVGHSAKLTDEELTRAWQGRELGCSFREFCAQYTLTNRTSVKARLTRLGFLGKSSSMTVESAPLPDPVRIAEQSPAVQGAWLAGLLEGEGTFRCRGGCPRIALEMTDEDVVATYASIVGAAYQRRLPTEARHKVSYICSAYGDRATLILKAVLPHMGERRSARIQEHLAIRATAQVILTAKQSAQISQKEAKLPAAEVTLRWTTRVAPANLSSFAREYGVHPQIMKERLQALGVYSLPAYKPCTDVTHTCAICYTPFVRKASQKGGQYCSRVCSGRAAAQRRSASATA